MRQRYSVYWTIMFAVGLLAWIAGCASHAEESDRFDKPSWALYPMVGEMPPCTDLELTIKPTKAEYRQGEMVTLDITLRKVTPGEFSSDLIVPIENIEYRVFDNHGERMPLTNYGSLHQYYFSVKTGGGPHQQLAEGESAKYQVPVNLLYDLTLPGKYTVSAKCYFKQLSKGNQLKEYQVVSPPVQVEVRE